MTTKTEARTANMVLPQWGVKCFYETFVRKRTVVLLLNIWAKNPHCGNTRTVGGNPKKDTTIIKYERKKHNKDCGNNVC